MDTHLQFIIGVHAADPGLTERSIGRARTVGGASSYEAFCRFAQPAAGDSVLDLACGNGPLSAIVADRVGCRGRVVGIDLSVAEVAAASARLRGRHNTRFLNARADSTGLVDSSVDLVMCHMAFMLFTPLTPVVQEMARILKSGGAFSAVVPTLRKPTQLFAACAGSLRTALVAEGLEKDAVSGNGVPMGCMADLKEIFPPECWKTDGIAVADIEVFLSAAPGEMLGLVAPAFYNHRLLSDGARRRVDAEWLGLFREHCDQTGLVRFDFPLSAFLVRRR